MSDDDLRTAHNGVCPVEHARDRYYQEGFILGELFRGEDDPEAIEAGAPPVIRAACKSCGTVGRMEQIIDGDKRDARRRARIAWIQHPQIEEHLDPLPGGESED